MHKQATLGAQSSGGWRIRQCFADIPYLGQPGYSDVRILRSRLGTNEPSNLSRIPLVLVSGALGTAKLWVFPEADTAQLVASMDAAADDLNAESEQRCARSEGVEIFVKITELRLDGIEQVDRNKMEVKS